MQMKLIMLEKILENKYNHLLIGEILFILAFSAVDGLKIEFPALGCFFLMVMIPALHVVLSFRAFVALMSLGVGVVLLRILAYFNVFASEIEQAVIMLTDVFSVFFLLFAIIALIKRISASRVVTTDTIKGGVSVYFLIGVLWTFLYKVALGIDPNAYSHISNEMVDCCYYSFATLTTLGPGDISPVSTSAKFLAILEAFVGQVYLAIFIAQLMGLHLGTKLQEAK
jgi:hypothetical protein